jgi:hypothetical protein
MTQITGMMERATKNQKNPKKRAFHTGLLQLFCCELVIATRYLDQDQSFYQLVRQTYARCAAINNQISLWEHSADATEKWLLGRKAPAEDSLGKLLQTLKVIHEKLLRST